MKKWTQEQHSHPTVEVSFNTHLFNFGLVTDILYRSHTQSDNHIIVNDDEAASSTCRPTLKLLKGKLLSIIGVCPHWRGDKKKKKPSFYDPWSMAVSASAGLLESCLGAVVTVWPLTFYCLEKGLRTDSSSRQILYSYEIFLVLSAIYFTYTVLKLPSDAQFFF